MASPISLSKTVFRFLLVIMSFLALLTLLLFPFQEPGTESYVISVITLVVQVSFILFLVAALYFEWELLAPLEELE